MKGDGRAVFFKIVIWVVCCQAVASSSLTLLSLITHAFRIHASSHSPQGDFENEQSHTRPCQWLAGGRGGYYGHGGRAAAAPCALQRR